MHIANSASIRELSASDTAVIVDLAHYIWPISYKNTLTDEQIDSILASIYTDANLRDEMNSGHRFWLATLADQPAGYVSAYQEEEILWLKKIYVLPDLQGHGIGKVLIDTVLAAFPATREMRLFVYSGNAPAIAFYRRQQFQLLKECPVKMGDFHFTDYIFSKAIKR